MDDVEPARSIDRRPVQIKDVVYAARTPHGLCGAAARARGSHTTILEVLPYISDLNFALRTPPRLFAALPSLGVFAGAGLCRASDNMFL